MGIRDRLKSALGLGPKTHLAPGDAAPAIDVPDASGKRWTLADLRGKPAVIYFYPKDDTPGCTKEACSLRDAYAGLGGATVLGVSTDDARSHQAFAQKFNLPFPLLADVGGEMARRWGALGGSNARRVTFVLDADGRVTHVFDPVLDVFGHAGDVRRALGVA
ncbi:MAG: peroxiredoxin [Myxococcota bacterium]